MAQNRPTRPVYLVRDTRERDVAPHLPAELSARGFGLAVSQLNTADFLICERTAGEPAVLAAFERKTWADFARGEADLRSLNLGKMLRLRRRTGCQLYFLIEGPAFPSPKRKFGRIPCAHLVTLQTRLMVDHAVFVVPTATPEHTAHRLAGFVRAFAEPDPRAGSWAFVAAPATGGRAAPDPGPPDETEAPERAPAAEGPTPEAPTPETDEPEQGGGGASLVVPAELTVVIEKPENVAAALAWARLKGVSAAVGGELACRFSIADLASGRVTVEQIRQLRGPGGRSLRRDAVQSLLEVRRGAGPAARALIAGARGFSLAIAEQILAAMDLAAMSRDTTTPEALAALPVSSGARPGRLGRARAERLWRFLRFRATKALGELTLEEAVGAPGAPKAPAARSRSVPPGPRAGHRPPNPPPSGQNGRPRAERGASPSRGTARPPARPASGSPSRGVLQTGAAARPPLEPSGAPAALRPGPRPAGPPERPNSAGCAARPAPPGRPGDRPVPDPAPGRPAVRPAPPSRLGDRPAPDPAPGRPPGPSCPPSGGGAALCLARELARETDAFAEGLERLWLGPETTPSPAGPDLTAALDELWAEFVD